MFKVLRQENEETLKAQLNSILKLLKLCPNISKLISIEGLHMTNAVNTMLQLLTTQKPWK